MKKTMIAALCAAQLAMTPAFGAELPSDRAAGASQFGTFAGARLRVPLGNAREPKVRAGLTLAPVHQSQRSDGNVRTRFGEGMELSLSGGEKVGLALAGRPVAKLTPRGTEPGGQKLGISTVGWVAIGVGTIAALFLAFDAICTPSSKCFDDE